MMPVMEFITKNLNTYLEKLGEAPGILLVEYNNNIIGIWRKREKMNTRNI